MRVEHEITDETPSGAHRISPEREIGPAAILIVDSDRGAAQGLVRFFAATRPCITVATAREARGHLRSEPAALCGVIVGANLPDGPGIEVIAVARDVAPHAPAVLMATTIEAAVANRAYVLGASCLLKPISSEPLRRFLSDAMASEIVPNEGVRRRVASFALRYELTPAATQILMAKIEGYTRDEILELRQVRANTYKTHVRQILQRTNMNSLEEVRRAVLGPTASARPVLKAV